jgi:hypothetical protein
MRLQDKITGKTIARAPAGRVIKEVLVASPAPSGAVA